jgi:glutamate/tyrosine decarboxylase-like PLP-dependent enzyme
MYWKAISRKEINERVEDALEQNASYARGEVIGTPATYLDQEEFYPDASFLKDAPFLRTLIANPNHIGCHTLNKQSSPIFKGTQAIERELISLCAEEIFRAEPNSVDGYVATGGTEANLEALWIYRNYFREEYQAKAAEVGVLFSEDTHYSITKGCDLLGINPLMISVDEHNRQMDHAELRQRLKEAARGGIKYFIVIINVSTTMFGSVDEIEPVTMALEEAGLLYKLHLDAAFGGFIYPFTKKDPAHDFANGVVSSISIDGHKMLQTPYGTGIFLIRKGLMKYVANTYAQYVPGLDYTLCGSRSGANAIVIWMLLMNYGSEGWQKKMQELIERTDYVCEELRKLGIGFYRNPHINIVTIKASELPEKVARQFELVADTYESRPQWWKIVVMDHVSRDLLERFIQAVKTDLNKV